MMLPMQSTPSQLTRYSVNLIGSDRWIINTTNRLAPAWCLFVWILFTGVEIRADEDFAASIQPIFDRSCVDCHGPETQKGGLRLDSLAQLALGGSSGPTVIPGDIRQGSLIARLRHEDPEERMPPEKKKPLTEQQIAAIEHWIQEGAKELAQLEKAPFPEEAYEHWSLKPLSSPSIPELSAESMDWTRNPVDHFIFQKQTEEGLSPSPEADRRTLIRRLYFDLTGLPPTPAEIKTFEQSSDPGAYEKLVDRLLASQAYGERWARHWLDVVHYADTHGYDKDKLRMNAWPYRDYVIRSFNQDKPYSRFVEEQLAGDVLYPNTRDGITATGFIAAGPWDFIGHAEVPETKLDGRIARHLDRDDMVTTTMNTFVSTTVECARCHHHKFDPVRMEDYYRLQAVFAALDRADKTFDANPEVTEKRKRWSADIVAAKGEIGEITTTIKEVAGPAWTALDNAIRQLESDKDSKPAAYGYHSAVAEKQDIIKWVQIDLGQPQTIQSITLTGCDDEFNGIGAGFGFPRRFRIEASLEAAFGESVVLLADRTKEDIPNPGVAPLRIDTAPIKTRYIRITATKLALRANDYIFALAELMAMDANGKNVARGSMVTALDSIEAPVRWAKSNLVDGLYVNMEQNAPDGKSIQQLKEERDHLWNQATKPEWAYRLQKLNQTLQNLESNLASLPEPSKVYAGTIHKGNGAFRGTGNEGGKPRPIHILARGDVAQPGREVGPGTIPVIMGQDTRFNLPKDHSEGERRVALARWILDKHHPLTWRSIVNRVWHYHFGTGICDTPNDFGHMGGQPSHPELLDWLAVYFRDNGQSFKQLHRLILTSATYRQTSRTDSAKFALDSGNRYLWKMNRRRLEAESLRDSVLLLAGKLDQTMGGPAFMDFVLEKPEHSPHYEYRLYDPMNPLSHRRSIYRFIVRSQQQPFMTTLDCADPSLLVGSRNETLTPNQSLALLNNPFMIALSEAWAETLSKQHPQTRSQIQRAFEEATGQKPTQEEMNRWETYANAHGLANTCRWMFNLNGFMFVD